MGSSRGVGLVVLVVTLTVAACGGANPSTVSATVHPTPHQSRGQCRDRFVATDLQHVTKGPGTSRSMLDGTGSGLGIGDLDHDGRPDIVLANLSGDSSILWNRGDLAFEREPLVQGRFRQAVVIDVDADGLNDIVMTTGVGRPVLLRNRGAASSAAERFERTVIDGVDSYTYALAWGDLGGDGDLDLVTGSYNAELTANRRLELGNLGGVSVFENHGGQFTGTQLTRDAQAMVVRIADLNADERADIHVGNDLATPDQVWLDHDQGWERVAPFPQTTYSTMGTDAADIDNDGDLDLFSTDMKPPSDDTRTLDAYAEVYADLAASPVVDAVQAPENVLLDPIDGSYDSRAADAGVAATGWSWSGVFGDLDNDGHSDLYVVNGMVADELFAHLEGGELIETNMAFRNVDGSFALEPSWGLDDSAGGRGMAMTDLDRDGDLDIVVNNLNAPSRLFTNELCAGSSITIDLVWENRANRTGLGSIVTVRSDRGEQIRAIEATRGYLTGAAPTAHVGLGDEATAVDIEVRWPDGSVTVVPDLVPDHHVVITRDAP